MAWCPSGPLASRFGDLIDAQRSPFLFGIDE